jgi:hypothetical protein
VCGAWVDATLEELKNAPKQIEERTGHEEVAIADLPAPRATTFGEPLASSYIGNRLQQQAGSFRKKATALEQRVSLWKQSSLPLFVPSLLCVLANFAIEWVHNSEWFL